MAPLQTFVGVDVGGARGKTTALAVLVDSPEGATVVSLFSRYNNRPLDDGEVLRKLSEFSVSDTVIAMNAPLTVPACGRCELPSCPSKSQCPTDTVKWLVRSGEDLATTAKQGPDSVWTGSKSKRDSLEPYYHRVTEVILHFQHAAIPHGLLGGSVGRIGARARHLLKQLCAQGYVFNENVIEVSPRATVSLLLDASYAQRYRRDANPWSTRQAVLESLDIKFSLSSGMSKERVLQNDDCFDALLSAYTACLRAKEDWKIPSRYGAYASKDGWIWSPADRTNLLNIT